MMNTKQQRINEARIYIFNRFNNMDNKEYENLCYGDGLLKVADEAMDKFNVKYDDIQEVFHECSRYPGKTYFGKYLLSTKQLLDTASQLYLTLDDFETNTGREFFETDEQYRNHIVGKLKFFIDLYTNINIITMYNDTATADTYYAFLKLLCPDYNDDDFSDVMNDYANWLDDIIDDIFDVFDADGWYDNDEVLSFISNNDQFNFQEQQFIIDCYYSTCGKWKIMLQTDDGLEYETDYINCRKLAAINSFCKEHNCDVDDIFVQEFND